MLFFVQLVRMDYGRSTVKTESFNSRQLARKGVAVWCGAQFKMGFMVFSFTDQPNFMAAHVDLVLHFFESLLNKNTTCEVGPVGIIKSLKMATLNSSREAATTFFIAL